MKNTSNYKLNKPESTDMYNVEHFNANMDTIDAELKARMTNTEFSNQKKTIEQSITNTNNQISNHTSNKSNPHGVTKTQVGLGNVDNTSDLNKPISNAMQKAIDDIKKDIIDVDAINEASGSPILLTDTADGSVSDFRCFGRSTQDGEPTPDSPIAIKSVADSGWFDGELLQGYYNTDGSVNGVAQHVSAKNLIPCNVGDVIKFTYVETVTKLVILFFDDTKYLSQVGADNSAIVNATAPSGATRFGITIQRVNSITPQTAKKIVVTINDTYAFIEKSVCKNLLNINERDKNTGDFSYTEYTNEIVKGSAKAGAAGAFICSFSAYLENGKTYFFSQESTNLNSVYIYSDRLWGNSIGNVNVVTAPYYTHKADNGTYIIGYYSDITSGTEYSVVKPMLRLAEVTDDTYEPYKEKISYIPLSAPLRGVGDVKDEVSLGENKATRKFAEVVLDGSGDEGWTLSKVVGNYAYFHIPTNGKIYAQNEQPTVLCDRFTVLSGLSQYDNPTQDCILSNSGLSSNARLWFVTKQATDLSTWKAWLQANPITVIYELAEPIIEAIEPVDIVTYDNVTYLTASDNAEMWVEYYSNSSVGQRLAKTNEEMRAEHRQLQEQITEHASKVDNPHKVTKAQVGLGNVPNVATNDQTPTYTTASANANLTSGEKLSVAFGKIAKAISSLISHLSNTNNPHSVTKAQVGLGNVNNTSDEDKPISNATNTALNNISRDVASVKDYQSIKDVYSNNTGTIKVRINGQLVEMIGTDATNTELSSAMLALQSLGYCPSNSIFNICGYKVDGTSKVGRIVLAGKNARVQEISTGNNVSDCTVTFNAMWLVNSTSVG